MSRLHQISARPANRARMAQERLARPKPAILACNARATAFCTIATANPAYSTDGVTHFASTMSGALHS